MNDRESCAAAGIAAKIKNLKQKADTANASEKAVIAQKIRLLTPGGEQIIAALELEER